MSKTAQPLSIEQINRAIVIDFEGFMDRPPSLAGTFIDDYYRCTVFTDVDPALAIAADATGCVKAHLPPVLAASKRHKHVGWSKRSNASSIGIGLNRTPLDDCRMPLKQAIGRRATKSTSGKIRSHCSELNT